MSTLVLLGLASSVVRTEEWRTPARGEPFPGFGRCVPYEAVLDHCDLVLVGRVLRQERYEPPLSREQPERLGRIELAVQEVLKGEFPRNMAVIVHGSGELTGVGDTNRLYCFLCLRCADGTLRLAGDPPEGGGFVMERPELMRGIIEAARDPLRAYASTNFSVRLSAAYRLARQWVALPREQRPPPPPFLIETLVEGLFPTEARGPNVNAAARDAINAVFECDIHKIWEYSVRLRKGRRTKLATEVRDCWQRTREAVLKRRKERAQVPGEDNLALQRKIADLIQQLGSEDYPERQAAHDELLRIGRPALRQVEEGRMSENKRIAEGCRLLATLIPQIRDYRPIAQSYLFDLDLAEPFVPQDAALSEDRREAGRNDSQGVCNVGAP
ncbi:MAG: hypothetical protein ACUVWX_01805 [Kiritimatiellia bacterium]